MTDPSSDPVAAPAVPTGEAADAPTEPSGPPPEPDRTWPGLLAAALAAALVVTSVVFALYQRGRAEDLAAERSDRRDIERVAATFGQVYLSYDFADVDSSSRRVLDLVTPDFARDFEETRVPGLEDLFVNLQTTTSATTTEVFVADVGDDAARALVVVDVTATSTASGTQTLTDLTFVLDLARVDDRWLVDRVAPAPQPDVGGDETATTTTTAASG